MATEKVLSRLSNTRDLRAEIASLAADLAETGGSGRLVVRDTLVNEKTVSAEWQRVLHAFDAGLRERMTLVFEHSQSKSSFVIESEVVLLDRPNWRFEILRQLIVAAFDGLGALSAQQLCERIGASQTPIRRALGDLVRSGLIQTQGRGAFHVQPTSVTPEALSKTRALPQVVHFRYKRGAVIKSAERLLQRANALMSARENAGWGTFSISGTPVAGEDFPDFDLLGIPRIDLLLHVPRAEKAFDFGLLRKLDDSLELEPAVLAHSPVVMTLVRADVVDARSGAGAFARRAHPADVFLSLLDIGLRGQAHDYAKAIQS
ncbi:MAG: GntR family transcriptional regulator [Pseudomonadota bacterium]